MWQHYSVSWKKGLAALCLLAVAGLSGCDQKENAAAKGQYDGLSNSQPLRVDANNHTKKGLAALCLLAVAGLSGCDQKENAAAKGQYDGLSNSQPLRVDANNHTVT